MSDTASNVEIEDLLASVRRLVSAERDPQGEEGHDSPAAPADSAPSEPTGKPTFDRLVLTADLRVAGGDDRVGTTTAVPVDEEAPGADEVKEPPMVLGVKPTRPVRPAAVRATETVQTTVEKGGDARMLTLEERIAQLEAAVVTHANAEFEPDGSEDQTQHRPTRILGLRPTDADRRDAAPFAGDTTTDEGPVAGPSDDRASESSGDAEELPEPAFRHADADDSRQHDGSFAETDAREAEDDGETAGAGTDSAATGEDLSWQEALVERLRRNAAGDVSQQATPNGDAAEEHDSIVEMFHHRTDSQDREATPEGDRPVRFRQRPDSGAYPFDGRDGEGPEEQRPFDHDGWDERVYPAGEDELSGLEFVEETQEIDEEMLRDLVAEIVRAELQGALGERITRNVRKLVRREIMRALSIREFE